MHVAFFASGGPGNLQAALDVETDRPDLVHIGLLVTDRPNIPAIELAQSRGIPVLTGSFDVDCGRWSEACGDAEAEQQYRVRATRYHDHILTLIKTQEERLQWKFDLAVLAYRRWIHGDLLEYFHERMINQHPGDLSVLEGHPAVRRYIGLNAVSKALNDGVGRTRTSTFLVRKGPDSGEILCQGPWTRFSFKTVSNETVHLHEDIQKRESDWPALRFALSGLALGKFGVALKAKHPDGCKVVIYEGMDQPYRGVGLLPAEQAHDTLMTEDERRTEEQSQVLNLSTKELYENTVGHRNR